MKKKPYTVVATCTCGCKTTEVHWIRAANPVKAMGQLKPRMRVIAIFDGHHHDIKQKVAS